MDVSMALYGNAAAPRIFGGTKMCLTLLLLPMQSVHITTKVLSSNPTQVGVLDTTLCDCQ